MDWRQQLLDSGLWLLESYVIAVLLYIGTVALLVRSTQWGRQFWKISGEYFSPRRHPRILAMLAVILLFTLLAVRINVLLSNWYNGFYTAMQQLNASAFWRSILVFCVLATIHVVRTLLGFYINQKFSIRWRVWLNESLLSRWLNHQAYYRSQYVANPADNPDQRLQQDIDSLVGMSLSLSMGTVNALVSIVAYTLMLWGLSGVLPLFGYEIPRGMVFMVFIYVLISTLIAFRIGRPLIRLSFLDEQRNADYRYSLMRLREYSENIAFYCGEKVEGTQLRSRFNAIINNTWQIVFRTLKFDGFNLVVNQTSAVFPFIIQAKRFFAKQISLGDVIQTGQAFSNLHTNLSFFREAYGTFASYRAVLNRLAGFDQAIDQADALPIPTRRVEGARVALANLTVRRPDGQPLVTAATLEAYPGEPLLIRGDSGVGKTTLLRAMAGLWPYCEGQIIRPDQQAMFLSQKPYLPLGTLRDALYYPNPAGNDDAAARQALDEVQLGYLANHLDEPADWSRILSLGEQQRLAFGRLLIGKPQAAFLDEATSAMDETMELKLYSLLCERLSHSILVSVGHRSTLLQHHPRQLLLKGNGQWALATD